MPIYIFHRYAHWYPVALPDDKAARDDAVRNQGTTRVEDAEGRIVWELVSEKAEAH
jgi:hypothetical protein